MNEIHFTVQNYQKKAQKRKKQLCIIMLQKCILQKCIDQCMTLSKKIKKMGNKYDPITLFLQVYNHDKGFQKKELTDITRKTDKEEWLIQLGKNDKEESVDLPYMPTLEGDKEAKTGKRIKNLDFKQIAYHTSIIISTNKNWEQFIKNRKWIQRNIIAFASSIIKSTKKFTKN